MCIGEPHESSKSGVTTHRPADVYAQLSHSQLPIKIALGAPERVGLDRLVAAVAANRLRSQTRPAVVIDSGTAITVDLLDASGTFQGGAIMPGFALAARALADHTDRLPCIEKSLQDPPAAIGKATEDAIRSGLFYGCVGGVKELIREYTKELGIDPQVFIAGGDSRLLAPLIEGSVFVEDLVLQGIVAAVDRS